MLTFVLQSITYQLLWQRFWQSNQNQICFSKPTNWGKLSTCGVSNSNSGQTFNLNVFMEKKKSADEHVARLFLRDYMHIQMLMCFLTGWIVDSEVLSVPQHSFTPWSLFVASGDIETLMPSAGGFGVRHPITNCRNLYSYCQTKVHHHPTLNTITVKLGN